MSKHATMSLWNRAEDGHYEAEIAGSRLSVRWHAEDAENPRGFSWQVHGPTGIVLSSHEREEEIEVAMGMAEDVAEGHNKPEQTLEVTEPHTH